MEVDHKKYLLKNKLNNNSNKELNKLTKWLMRKSMYYETIMGWILRKILKQTHCRVKNFWNRINKLKNDGIEKRSYFPVMNHNNKQYKTDHEKANMFGTILSETFKDNEDEKYDKNFKK
jgi:hypothetical protein